MKRDVKPSVDPVIPTLHVPRGAHSGRRKFLQRAGALGGSAGLLGYDMRLAAAGPLPETKRIRLVGGPAICIAPQYVAEALLRAEGFTEVEYVKFDRTLTPRRTVANGLADVILDSVGDVVIDIDAGVPLV